MGNVNSGDAFGISTVRVMGLGVAKAGTVAESPPKRAARPTVAITDKTLILDIWGDLILHV
jgi:hypothetical protein